MKKITLTQGYQAIVDDDDFDWLSMMPWHAVKTGRGGAYVYAANSKREDGRSKRTMMHRLIADAIGKPGLVDHENGDTLDNRRSNIRRCNRSGNRANSSKSSPAASPFSSRFKGVRRASSGRWIARIGAGGQRVGMFDHEIAAALAYDMAARERYGAFARINFPYGAG